MKVDEITQTTKHLISLICHSSFTSVISHPSDHPVVVLSTLYLSSAVQKQCL